MKWSSLAINLVAISLLASCSPTFNWRSTQLEVETHQLVGVLPCKPDQATRNVPLGTQTLELHMQGCEAGGATFTLAGARVAEPALLAPTLRAWREATLRQVQAGAGAVGSPVQPTNPPPMQLAGATPVPGSGRQSIEGRAADGSALGLQVAWFARGLTLYQAAIYVQGGNARLPADAPDAFFGGLRLP